MNVLNAARKSEVALLGLLVLAVSALASRFPATGDDWSWGTSTGSDRFWAGFAGYNGRYLGNLAVLVLTRAGWLTPCFVAVTLALLLHLLVRVAGLRTLPGYLLGAALVVAMPLGTWRQTIVWVSGFSNYALASVCLLTFLVLVQRDLTTGWHHPRLVAAGVLPFAVASELFMEHVSVYLLLAALAYLGVTLLRRRPFLVPAAWAAGSVIGVVVMFSNAAYRRAADGSAQYQGIGASEQATGSHGVVAILRQASGGVSQYAVTANTALNLALLVAVAVLALTVRQSSGALTHLQRAAPISAAVAAAGSAAVWSSVDAQHYFGALTSWSWLPALAQLGAIVATALTLVHDRTRSRTILALAASAVLLIIPMAAVTPYGPRNFLPSYLLLVAITLCLVAEIGEHEPARFLQPVVASVGAAVVVSVLAGYAAVYSELDEAAHARVAAVRDAAQRGRGSVTVHRLPHLGYLHNPDPEGARLTDFKRFYRLPLRIRIRVAP